MGVSMSEVYMTAKLTQTFTTDSVVVRWAQCLRQGDVAGRAHDTQVRYASQQMAKHIEGHFPRGIMVSWNISDA